MASTKSFHDLMMHTTPVKRLGQVCIPFPSRTLKTMGYPHGASTTTSSVIPKGLLARSLGGTWRMLVIVLGSRWRFVGRQGRSRPLIFMDGDFRFRGRRRGGQGTRGDAGRAVDHVVGLSTQASAIMNGLQDDGGFSSGHLTDISHSGGITTRTYPRKRNLLASWSIKLHHPTSP